MKSYTPFTVIMGISLGICLWQLRHQNNCLFTFQNHCFTCDEKEVFFVGLPENCNVCPNRQPRYVDWNAKSIWACLNTPIAEDEEILFTESIADTPCQKQYPLKDILGHCYSCDTSEPIQILQESENTCGKQRYLTHYRNSEKSNLCPNLDQIRNPYVCIACQGQWQNEKCTSISLTPMNFCQKNSDCYEEQWCYPFQHPLYSKSGICRPSVRTKWICSDLDGYTYETAETFCARQNAHIPSFQELTDKASLHACDNTQIWAIFEEGSIYLESLKTPFPITREKESFELSGDNTHALCVQN